MILETSDISLFYEKYGKGDPIILLHGNGETHEIFKKSISVLQQRFTVYAVDTRGHGNSSQILEYHYEEMANDFYEFIEKLEIKKPIIYGFSDGGIIALILAIKYPQLLSQIIISGVNTTPAGLKLAFYSFLKFSYLLSKLPQIKVMLEEPNITNDMLSLISIPVHITAGSKDIMKKTHLKNIAENISNCTLTIFPHESHGSYIVNSEKIADFILKIC